MFKSHFPLILGGLTPAVLFAVSAVLQKQTVQSGIGLGFYIIVIGTGMLLTGVAIFLLFPDKLISLKSASFGFSSGVFAAIGIALVGLTIIKYGTPLSQLVPIYNINTLFAVLLALVVFSEWQNVNVSTLMIGTLMVTTGAIFVANA